MSSELTDDQRALATLMSELSEEGWCAGWMLGLEFDLWGAVCGGPCSYGRLDITRQHIDKLRVLSARCGGWIVFSLECGEESLSHDDWARTYDGWDRAGALVER